MTRYTRASIRRLSSRGLRALNRKRNDFTQIEKKVRRKSVSDQSFQSEVKEIVASHANFVESIYFKEFKDVFPDKYEETPFVALMHPLAIHLVINYWMSNLNNKKAMRMIGFLGVPFCITQGYDQSIKTSMNCNLLRETKACNAYSSMIKCIKIDQFEKICELFIKKKHFESNISGFYQNIYLSNDKKDINKNCLAIKESLNNQYKCSFQELRAMQMLVETMFFAEGARAIILPSATNARVNWALRSAALALSKIADGDLRKSWGKVAFQNIFPAANTFELARQVREECKTASQRSNNRLVPHTPRTRAAYVTPSRNKRRSRLMVADGFCDNNQVAMFRSGIVKLSYELIDVRQNSEPRTPN